MLDSVYSFINLMRSLRGDNILEELYELIHYISAQVRESSLFLHTPFTSSGSAFSRFRRALFRRFDEGSNPFDLAFRFFSSKALTRLNHECRGLESSVRLG